MHSNQNTSFLSLGETGERKSAVATPDGKSRKKKNQNTSQATVLIRHTKMCSYSYKGHLSDVEYCEVVTVRTE